MKSPLLPAIALYPPFEGFPKEGITFLKKLKKNNTREWFTAHKTEYEENVKQPMLSLIVAMKAELQQFAPDIDADPKRSMFRIYRDTRFSKDKTPYKTHAAAIFHPRGHWQNSAGFYLHIEPGKIYLGGGMYMPDGAQLKLIRAAIAQNADEFIALVQRKQFQKRFGGKIEGEKLQRIPMGYAVEHPMAEWLKLKQFYTMVTLEEKECYTKKFITNVVAVYSDGLPLVRFLNNALGKAG
jgi:uncharacterized protein (TIGR02453 family)